MQHRYMGSKLYITDKKKKKEEHIVCQRYLLSFWNSIATTAKVYVSLFSIRVKCLSKKFKLAFRLTKCIHLNHIRNNACHIVEMTD